MKDKPLQPAEPSKNLADREVAATFESASKKLSMIESRLVSFGHTRTSEISSKIEQAQRLITNINEIKASSGDKKEARQVQKKLEKLKTRLFEVFEVLESEIQNISKPQETKSAEAPRVQEEQLSQLSAQEVPSSELPVLDNKRELMVAKLALTGNSPDDIDYALELTDPEKIQQNAYVKEQVDAVILALSQGEVSEELLAIFASTIKSDKKTALQLINNFKEKYKNQAIADILSKQSWKQRFGTMVGKGLIYAGAGTLFSSVLGPGGLALTISSSRMLDTFFTNKRNEKEIDQRQRELLAALGDESKIQEARNEMLSQVSVNLFTRISEYNPENEQLKQLQEKSVTSSLTDGERMEYAGIMGRQRDALIEQIVLSLKIRYPHLHEDQVLVMAANIARMDQEGNEIHEESLRFEHRNRGVFARLSETIATNPFMASMAKFYEKTSATTGHEKAISTAVFGAAGYLARETPVVREVLMGFMGMKMGEAVGNLLSAKDKAMLSSVSIEELMQHPEQLSKAIVQLRDTQWKKLNASEAIKLQKKVDGVIQARLNKATVGKGVSEIMEAQDIEAQLIRQAVRDVYNQKAKNEDDAKTKVWMGRITGAALGAVFGDDVMRALGSQVGSLVGKVRDQFSVSTQAPEVLADAARATQSEVISSAINPELDEVIGSAPQDMDQINADYNINKDASDVVTSSPEEVLIQKPVAFALTKGEGVSQGLLRAVKEGLMNQEQLSAFATKQHQLFIDAVAKGEIKIDSALYNKLENAYNQNPDPQLRGAIAAKLFGVMNRSLDLQQVGNQFKVLPDGTVEGISQKVIDQTKLGDVKSTAEAIAKEFNEIQAGKPDVTYVSASQSASRAEDVMSAAEAKQKAIIEAADERARTIREEGDARMKEIREAGERRAQELREEGEKRMQDMREAGDLRAQELREAGEAKMQEVREQAEENMRKVREGARTTPSLQQESAHETVSPVADEVSDVSNSEKIDTTVLQESIEEKIRTAQKGLSDKLEIFHIANGRVQLPDEAFVKKGGLPKEFWHQEDKILISTLNNSSLRQAYGFGSMAFEFIKDSDGNIKNVIIDGGLFDFDPLYQPGGASRSLIEEVANTSNINFWNNIGPDRDLPATMSLVRAEAAKAYQMFAAIEFMEKNGMQDSAEIKFLTNEISLIQQDLKKMFGQDVLRFLHTKDEVAKIISQKPDDPKLMGSVRSFFKNLRKHK